MSNVLPSVMPALPRISVTKKYFKNEYNLFFLLMVFAHFKISCCSTLIWNRRKIRRCGLGLDWILV